MEAKEQVANLEKLQEEIRLHALEKLKSGQALDSNFLKEISQRTLQALLDAEMEEHLGYQRHERQKANPTNNARNGRGRKKVKTDLGEMELAPPRDRNGTFMPQIIQKRSTTLGDFQDKILSLYTRGISTREMEEHLRELYGIEVSPEYISRAVETVQGEVIQWQNRPLEPFLPIIYIDAMRVAVKADGNRSQVLKKAVYTVLGVSLEGRKEVLGLWVQETEGARFWLKVLQDIQARGVHDVLIFCADGLTGIEEAIAAVFPAADLQRCVVHQVRNATKFVSYKDRRVFCAAMRQIYTAPTLEAAELAMVEFSDRWEKIYPASVDSWQRNWDHLTTFFKYPPEIRTIIYTTNAIESLHSQMRKNLNGRKVFPSDESVLRLIFLNVRNFSKRWTSRHGWDKVVQQFVILFGERVTKWLHT